MCSTITHQVVLLLALSTSWLKASSDILREAYTCESKCICYNKPFDGQDERFVAECTNVKEDDLENLRNLPSNVTDLIIANSTLPTLHFSSSIPTHFLKLLCVTFDRCNSTYIMLNQQSEYLDLQNITIRNNPIDIIQEDTFRQFPNVQHINFDHNGVRTVYEDAFKDLYSVEVINISFNNITKMEKGFFKNVPNLQLIDLSNNNKLVPFKYTKSNGYPIIISHNQNITTDEWPSRFYPIFDTISIIHVFTTVFSLVVAAGISSLLYVFWQTFPDERKEINRLLSSSQKTEIGQIIYDPRACLGDNVWKGSLIDKQKAAIKRSQNTSCQSQKELDILIRMSRVHPNPHVVQYMCREEDATYRYVALELFDMNLEKAIRTNFINGNSYLLQLADGLRHIHRQGIEHGDIKPQNILLKTESGKVILAISDFDLGHCADEQSEHKKPYGTKGWAAPELWKGGVRTTAVDVFSLGCVFYYVLTKGCHPFGPIDNLEQCQNCICNETETPELPELKKEPTGEFKVILAKELITSMIEREQRKRPKARWVLQHPMFWSDERISKFYHEIGNMAVDKERSQFQAKLRADTSEVYSGDWTSPLDEAVKIDVNKKVKKSVQKVNNADICRLLRAIRNKTEYFDEVNKEVKDTYYYGCSEGVAKYFNEKFPKLLLYTFQKKEELEQLNRTPTT